MGGGFLKIKRLLFLFIIIISVCSCSNQKNNISTISSEVSKFDISCKYDIFDVCIDNAGKFYVADKDTIRIFNDKWKEIGQINNNLNFCTSVCVGGGSVYAYDNSDSKVKVFDIKGNFIETIEINDISRVKKIEFADGKLVFYRPNDTNLIIYDIKSKTTQKVPIDNIAGISRYKNNKLLVYKRSSDLMEKYISVYDFDSNNIIENYKIDRAINGFTYSGNDDTIYFFSNGNVYKYKLNGTIDPILRSNNDTFNIILSYEDSCYVIDVKNKLSYKVDKNGIAFDYPGTEKVQMVSDIRTDLNIISTIPNFEEQSEIKKLMEVFYQKYPYVNVRYEYINPTPKGYPDGEYDMEIRTRLMAQDSSLDIFLFNSNVQEATLLNSNSLADLSQYPSIVENYNDIFDGIKKLCTYKGKLIGVPSNITIEAWVVNDELLDKLNIECPKEDWTWNDFYEFAKNVRRDLDNDGYIDTVAFSFKSSTIDPLSAIDLANALYFNRDKGTASYNCQEFIDFLNVLKKIKDENLLVADEKAYNEKKVNAVFKKFSPSMIDGDTHFIPMPSISGKLVSPVWVRMLCINDSSKNKDIAAEYLSLYISKDIRLISNAYPPSIYKDLSYYENNNYAQNQSRKIISEKNFRLYEKMINNSALWVRDSDFSLYSGKVLTQFGDGEITAEQAADLINKKAEMVLGE